MRHREASVESAKEGTFEWQFEAKDKHDANGKDGGVINDYNNDGGSISWTSGRQSILDGIRQKELWRRATARNNFTKWLRIGGNIFHISGKAGSGKSTLMKFICSHERTREELLVWPVTERH